MTYHEPPYGITTVSWHAIWDDLYPGSREEPGGDGEATEMQRLRGLIVVQATETEEVLGQLLRQLEEPLGRLDMPAGALLRRLEDIPGVVAEWAGELALIEHAIRRRNRAVHDTVRVGHSWAPFATGGGEWVSVISLMGAQECDEADLVGDLALQQDATRSAVRMLASTYGVLGGH